jgi:hypothetical protein
MIDVKVTQSMLEEARQRSKDFYKKFGNTGTHRLNKERQRITGYLAETAINKSFSEITYSEDYVVDFLLENGDTIDSKAQGCNGKPLPHYSATLYEDQKNRNTDYYIFSRVKNDFSMVWICGIISKKKFFKIATLKKAGTQNNNFTYDQSRYEITYDQLADIDIFLDWHKKC